MTIVHDYDIDAMPKSMSVIEFGLVQWFNARWASGSVVLKCACADIPR
jgi:hypothetical protein